MTILRSTGAAVLLVSHDINLVARHAHRIAVCYDGQIVEINNAAEVLERPQHPYTISLLNAVPRKGEKLFAAVETKAEIVLEAENLRRVYGHGADSVSAVSRADLQVRRGEIVGIYGDSGSGKSTLLRLLATIETPSSGTVSLGDEAAASGESRRLSSVKARSGFVMPIFQDPIASLDRRWAIWRSVTEPLMAKHRKKFLSKFERREIARKILAEVGLSEINLDARPFELSVGQCQRVSIARAPVAEPALIVADEPTSALDVSVSATILQLLAQIAKRGTAIVVVSHDEAMLKTLCHRVLKMRGGVLEN
ncbi:MAG: ATP-binding cassette domain-containing protein [Pyrinomonadaceae bacterium]